MDLHLCLPPLRQSGFLRRRPVDVACCRRRQVAFFGGEASGQNGRHCCRRSRNRFHSAANSRHERRERVEIAAGGSRERRLDRAVVDRSMFGHLGSVTVEEAHRVTPCRSKCLRADSKPRRCSCLTAPGALAEHLGDLVDAELADDSQQHDRPLIRPAAGSTPPRCSTISSACIAAASVACARRPFVRGSSGTVSGRPPGGAVRRSAGCAQP